MTETTKYNIIRKHSGDTNTSVIETVKTKGEAREYIKEQIADLSATISTPHIINYLGDVTSIRFTGAKTYWSIGFWFEKA